MEMNDCQGLACIHSYIFMHVTFWFHSLKHAYIHIYMQQIVVVQDQRIGMWSYIILTYGGTVQMQRSTCELKF